MSFYSKHILPRLLNWAMDNKRLAPLRKELLSQAEGTVAELGFGSGMNLPFYPGAVKKVIGIDPSPELLERAKPRLANFPGDFESLLGGAERVPLDSGSVDCVVSTFTLCSVRDTLAVLQEAKRILRPGGKLLILEHGLSPDRKIQVWQHRLTPLNQRVAGGCHLDRNIMGLLADACVDVVKARKFYLEGVPKVAGYVTLAEACK